jgi:signal transduction histidine kinase
MIKTYHENDQVIVEVEDNGPGFPPGKVKSFSDLLTLKQGSYGLLLIKNIIEQHNGNIHLLERPFGVAIQFSLPVN